jgi:hypothetical protein
MSTVQQRNSDPFSALRNLFALTMPGGKVAAVRVDADSVRNDWLVGFGNDSIDRGIVGTLTDLRPRIALTPDRGAIAAGPRAGDPTGRERDQNFYSRADR